MVFAAGMFTTNPYSNVRRCVRDQSWFTPYLLGYLTAAKHPGAQSAPAVEGMRDDRVRIS
jgi:hypothetical protein